MTDILAYPMVLFRRRFSTCPYPYLPRPARVNPGPGPKRRAHVSANRESRDRSVLYFVIEAYTDITFI